MIFCGWDGGGTKTEICVTDESGRTLEAAVFGPLNLNGDDPKEVEKTIRDGLAFVRTWDDCAGMVIGAAGISNREAAARIREILAREGWSGQVQLSGDQEIALAGAIEGHGAILIAGTGSVLYGRTEAGSFFRVGGYGHLVDDGGSGYAIGRDIIAAAVRTEDGRENSPLLRQMVFEAENFSSVSDLITWLYAPGRQKWEIASLSRLLSEALARGDASAERIAEKAGGELAELAITGWRKTGMTDGTLAMTGGILNRISRIRSLVEAKMAEAFPKVRCARPLGSPAQGAARMARELFEKGAGEDPARTQKEPSAPKGQM